MAEPSFEKALDTLEKIVEEQEEGELTLDETIKKFEEGVKLARLCEKKLSAAQKKVSLLTKGEKGDVKETPFAPEGDTEGIERERAEASEGETESLFDE